MKIGSLFSGYGGLDMAAHAAFPHAETAWVCDFDKGPSKILAHRYPNIPNLVDVTKVDWTAIEPVDVITGGSPCQDLSHAGKRAGMTDGTRSNLWVAMREAIAQIRPTYVIWENVRGAYSAAADSAVEPCPGCVGDGPGVHLRALGRVLGDLSDLGYDCQWRGLRAADVGAPHGRFRVFIVARLADATRDTGRLINRDYGDAADAERVGHERAGQARNGRSGPADGDLGTLTLLPSPRATDGTKGGPNQRGMKAAHGNGNGHGASLSIEAQRLLPTPMAAEGTKPSNTMGVERRRATGEVFLTNVIVDQFGDDPHADPIPTRGTWGQYEAAIARWEPMVGRPAPSATEPIGRDDAHRLSARFTEWMMGLPDGWITDVPGITRNEALKACGNGVVPQQAHAAIVDALRTFARLDQVGAA